MNRRMKKLALAVMGAVALTLLLVAPAFAGSGSVVKPPDVKGIVVTAPGGTAFTGANVTVWMALVAVLVIVGVALLIAGRSVRRRSPSSSLPVQPPR